MLLILCLVLFNVLVRREGWASRLWYLSSQLARCVETKSHQGRFDVMTFHQQSCNVMFVMTFHQRSCNVLFPLGISSLIFLLLWLFGPDKHCNYLVEEEKYLCNIRHSFFFFLTVVIDVLWLWHFLDILFTSFSWYLGSKYFNGRPQNSVLH